MRAVHRLALAAAALTFALIVLGALVRVTDSGLACPDWPTCYGLWLPTPAAVAALGDVGYGYGQIMLEWWHRLIAGVFLGPLVLAIAVLAWRARGTEPRLPRYAFALLALLLFQAGLGGFTVLDQNSPWSVALHLGTALVLFSLILLIVERTRERPALGDPGRAPLALGVWLLALGTMVSAAMTAKTGASLACDTWPLCDGALVPDLSHGGVRLHFAHRVLAALTGIGVLALLLLARRQRPLAGLGLALVAAQVLLGAVVIVLLVPIWAAVLHQAVGVLVFAVITLLLWRCTAAAEPASGSARERLRSA